MLADRYGGRHSTGEPGVVAAYEAAVFEFLAHRPGAVVHLDVALSLDPDHVAGLALKGFGSVLLARSEHVASARLMAARVRTAMDSRDVTPFEQCLSAALELAARGEWLEAASCLQARLSDAPCDLLALKLAHALRFMTGDAAGMLAMTASVVDRWSPDRPGFGFMMGCHAFAMEEHGMYRQAEDAARLAVEREPHDAWGLHALSHVHTMENRADEGIAWLEATRPIWSQCNNFAYHLSWHGALMRLSRGDAAQALAVYDQEIRPNLADDFRDVANAVSLLWRLRQEDVDVGDRFEELRALASLRVKDSTLVFASLHHLLSMIACGDAAGASEIVNTISRRAGRQSGDQSAVAADVGLDLARAIAGLTLGGSRTDVGRLARLSTRIGGSNEQRDVFVRTLALIAADDGDENAADAILTMRRRIKRETRFAALVERRLADATNRGAARVVA